MYWWGFISKFNNRIAKVKNNNKIKFETHHFHIDNVLELNNQS